MSELKKTLEHTKEVIKDELKKLIKKGELTPSEMDTVFKAVDAIKDICELCHEDPDGNYSMGYQGYSGTQSYGQHWTRDPYAQARSPVTGRYISNGYSGHSIKDRMVARLEPMFDEASSDYEKQLIQNTINRIHAEN